MPMEFGIWCWNGLGRAALSIHLWDPPVCCNLSEKIILPPFWKGQPSGDTTNN